jgi:hypothetical protein
MCRRAASTSLTVNGRCAAGTTEEDRVPRYIVERVFRDGLEVPLGQRGVDLCRGVVGVNEDLGVTWVHSYVSDDRQRTFCVYDAPNPETIRLAAERNSLPVERITRVAVLDPYFYTPSSER